MRRVLAAVLVAVTLAACGAPLSIAPTATPEPSATPDPCAPAAITAYGTQIQPLLQTYFAQLGIAQSTPRMSLGPVLQGLFESEQAVNAVTAPPCLADFAGRVRNMMELYRTSMNQFAAQREGDSLINQTQADTIRAVIEPAVATVVAGQVPTLP